jgi:enoyl-CoA hydratase/carnithine racemase
VAGNILLQREDDGAVAVVTLSNPGKLNAIDAAMWRSLAVVMSELDADTALRAVVVRGAGTAFAAGGDLEEFRDARDTPDKALAYHEAVGRALDALTGCRHPTVALIHGPCVGGGLAVACACDLRIAGESARFGAPIGKLGFSMFPGEIAGLMAIAGPATVKEILLECRLLSAQHAYDRGLLTRVVADAEVEAEVFATARRIAAGAPLVARWHKQWIARLERGGPLTAEERRASFAFLDTADYREGMAAFLEKRSPRFAGQ